MRSYANSALKRCLFPFPLCDATFDMMKTALPMWIYSLKKNLHYYLGRTYGCENTSAGWKQLREDEHERLNVSFQVFAYPAEVI